MAIKIKAGWEECKFSGLAGGELIPGKPLKDLTATQLQAIMDGDPTNASIMLDGEVSAVPPVVDNAPEKPLPTKPTPIPAKAKEE
jgi:hypothetical protein